MGEGVEAQNERTALPGAEKPPVRVLICDVEPMVRAGLRASLQRPGIDVIGELDGVRQLMADVYGREFDVVLMGSTQEATGESGLSSIADRLKRRIAVVLGSSDRESFLLFVQSGIRGFVSSRTAPADVLEAVLSVARDEAYLSTDLARHLLDWLADKLGRNTLNPHMPTAKLSDRELEVLELLGNGNSNAAISRALRIQEATVRSHVYHILTKLNLNTRTEAVLYGFQRALSTVK